MRRSFIHRLAGVGLLMALLSGCSQTSERFALEGTVTMDGLPLPEGSITFIPQGNTKSPTCGGKISEGRFSIASEGGAASGTFRVEITALRNTGRKVRNPRDGAMIDEIVQYIPRNEVHPVVL
jgi:hypothetical protein